MFYLITFAANFVLTGIIWGASLEVPGVSVQAVAITTAWFGLNLFALLSCFDLVGKKK
jgi:hypothetical protein